MAGVGTLSNANWHMFEPSPIETQLAVADPVKNPRAVALLPGYQADREAAQNDYANQLDWTRQQQLAEFNQKAQNDQRTQLANILQHIATTPGGAGAARSAGLLPAGVDTSAMEQAANTAAQSKNTSEVLSGAGHAAQGNINVQSILDQLMPGSTQGPNPQITAAQINAAGRVAAENARAAGRAAATPSTTESVSYDPVTGEATPRITFNKGMHATPEALDEFKTRVNGSQVRTGMLANRNGQKPGGVTQLAPAQTDAAEAAPFANNTPQRAAPAPTGTALDGPIAPNTTPAPAAAAPVTNANDALAKFHAANPQGAIDVANRAKANGGKIDYAIVGGKPVLIGQSGQKYPLQ